MGGYSGTLDLDSGKKVGNLDLGGGYSGKVMEKKKPTLQKNCPDQFGIIPKSPIPSGLPNQC